MTDLTTSLKNIHNFNCNATQPTSCLLLLPNISTFFVLFIHTLSCTKTTSHLSFYQSISCRLMGVIGITAVASLHLAFLSERRNLTMVVAIVILLLPPRSIGCLLAATTEADCSSPFPLRLPRDQTRSVDRTRVTAAASFVTLRRDCRSNRRPSCSVLPVTHSYGSASRGRREGIAII